MLIYSIFLGLCLGVALMNIPPALDMLMAHYQVNYLGISVLITALLWTHALFQLPGGMIADRYGAKPTLGWGLVLLALGNMFPLLFSGMPLAIMGRVACGVGTGLSYAAAMKMLALAAPPERAGVYQAYMGGAVALGSIASFLALPHLALWDWRWPFVLPAALSCILLIMLCPVAAHHETNGRSKAPAQGLLSILALPQGWMLGLLHALSWGSVITLGNWGPSLLAQALGNSSTAQLAWVGAAVMLVSGVGRITGAPLLARFRPPLVAGMSMLLLAMVYLAISFAKGSSLTAVLIMAGAALASVNFGSIFQLACRAAGAEGLGGLLGFVNLLANVGAICFTLLLGWVRDQTDSFSPSFLMLAAACLSAGPAALLFYRRRS